MIGFLYYCLHDRIKALEERAGIRETHYQKLASLERIVKIIAAIAIIFCLFPSIHYLSTFFPRLDNSSDNLTFIQKHGIDYWGIIVGFLTLVVTFLVGWNIYSILKVKDDVRVYRKRLNNEVKSFKHRIEKIPNQKFSSIETRLSIFDECCKNRGDEIAKLKEEVFEKISAIEARNLINTAHFYIDTAEKANGDTKNRIYENAYQTVVEALVKLCAVPNTKSDINDCVSMAELCLREIKKGDGELLEITYNKTLDNLNKLTSDESQVKSTIKESIDKIINLQREVGYKPTMDTVIDWVRTIQKKKTTTSSNIFGTGIAAATTPLAASVAAVATAGLGLASKGISKQKRESDSLPKSSKRGKGGGKRKKN